MPDEWHWFDLLIQLERDATLVEIKFYYGLGQTFALDGSPTGWKGGPSPQNEAEFKQCFEKLQTTRLEEVTDKFLVLVYRRGEIKPGGKHSYESSYSDLARFGVSDAKTIEHCDAETVACTLIRVDSPLNQPCAAS